MGAQRQPGTPKSPTSKKSVSPVLRYGWAGTEMGPMGAGEGHPLAMCHSVCPLWMAPVTRYRHLWSSTALELPVSAERCRPGQGSDLSQDQLDLDAVPGPVLGTLGAPHTP